MIPPLALRTYSHGFYDRRACSFIYFLGPAGLVMHFFLETNFTHFRPSSALPRPSLNLLVNTGEHVHTLSDDWKSANKEFMKFQKMNPVHGISKGL